MRSLSRLLISLMLLFPALVLADTPAIAAAANIKFALDDIAKDFARDTGQTVRISYGSSGNFVAQIKNGAPFQLFMSADEKYIDQLQADGLVTAEPVEYAVGRLALAAPKNSPLTLDTELNGLKTMLAADKIKRFAIANPEHAPYGERAKEYLEHFGLWQSIQPKLIYGENASQAAQFAISGSTQGGIVPLSLVKAPQFTARANYIELPSEFHGNLAQDMVLLPNAGATARAFFDYLQSDKARQVFVDYGFALPRQ
ncbi:molybdate ABC transporter substrate-binding protein [Shewanella sp. GXUN23E]|uniref:molybdate ABC transporter substrate-binding protein n=1 Tax=Shewanella sp. GXUN23E TaxID=3422498 RepID=UPI003D7DA93A